MTQTITAEYIAGITDARAVFRSEGMTNAAAHLDNIERTIRSGFGPSSPVGQMLRGERDFWRNQIRKAQV